MIVKAVDSQSGCFFTLVVSRSDLRPLLEDDKSSCDVNGSGPPRLLQHLERLAKQCIPRLHLHIATFMRISSSEQVDECAARR